MRKKALMELSGDNVQRIDALKKHVKGNTRVDVVAQALQMFEWMLERYQDGDTFYVGKDKDSSEEIKIFGVKDQ